jgi:hypothetical protein
MQEIIAYRTDNKSFERVEQFRYYSKHQNSVQEGIKSRLKSGNACYHSVQYIFSSRFLSKKIKIKLRFCLAGFMSVKHGRSN